MAIFINFNNINVKSLSGGGVFIGQNLAFGWNSFTKSNTGISNSGNFSPITNALSIIDDRDVLDAPIFNNERPMIRLADGEIETAGRHFGHFTKNKKNRSSGGQDIIIKKNGRIIHPETS